MSEINILFTNNKFALNMKGKHSPTIQKRHGYTRGSFPLFSHLNTILELKKNYYSGFLCLRYNQKFAVDSGYLENVLSYLK